MNSLVLLLICIAVLLAGYIFYGGWLCKQWGVGENDGEAPAHELEDGVDYVPAKAPVLMGHHFSSIAGAGPITGPIGAAMFGWLPVTLWILAGGIFFGAVYDESGALDLAKSAAPASVAMISILFIVIAIVFGFLAYRRNVPMGIASVAGVLAIVVIMAIGLNFHPIYLSARHGCGW